MIEDEINNLEQELIDLSEKINNAYHDYQKVEPMLKKQKLLEIKIEEKYKRWQYLLDKVEVD